MAGTNNFLQWNPSSTNQENDAAYSADSLRANGAPSGAIFPSPTANKLFYQCTSMVAALAQMMANKNYNMSDANEANLIAALANLVAKADVPGYLVQWSEVPGQFVRFSDFTKGNNANGYWEKNGASGSIRQWGSINTDINNGQLGVTFPTAFTNAASISVVCTTRGAASFDRIIYVISGSVTVNGFTVANNGSGGFGYWQAMGY
jgi:hypothetical protein